MQDEPLKEKRRRIAVVGDARKRANEKYRKKSVKQFAVRFYPAEADVWEPPGPAQQGGLHQGADMRRYGESSRAARIRA